MANDTSASPWILDTAGTIRTGPVRVTKMEWRPNATDDDLQVSDHTGRAKWVVKALAPAQGGLELWESANGESFNGFQLTTIDGGTLYVWVA